MTHPTGQQEYGTLAKQARWQLAGSLLRYGLAVVTVAVALGVRQALENWFGNGLPPYITFYPAMMVVVILTGFGPSVLATVLMTLIADYWILPPVGQFAVASLVDRLGLAIFTSMNLMMCVFAEMYRRSREKAAAFDRESALHESRERLAAFAEATFEGIVESENGRVMDCNEQFARMVGYSLPELRGKELYELIAPESREQVREIMHQGQESIIEHELIRKDGARIVIEAHGRPVIPGGRRRHTAIRDITQGKRAAEAIRRAKEEWERTFDSVPDLIAIIDNQHRITRVNQAMANHLDLLPEQCIGVPCHTAIHGVGAPPSFCPHAMSMADLTEHETEVSEPALGGNFLVTTTPLFDSQGEFYASVHVARDITQLKNTERSLRESEELLRFHLENSPLAVVEWDSWFNITRWTGEAERMFGWSEAEAVGRHFAELNLVYEEDIPIIADTMGQLTDGVTRKVVTTNRNITRDGAVRHCTWYNSVLLDSEGRMLSVLSKVIDITDRVVAEEALKRAHDELELRVAERTSELEAAVDILQVEIADRRKAEEELERSAREIEDLYNLAPCGYHSLDKDGTFVRINDTELKWLGYERDEVVGRLRAADVLTPESLLRFRENFPAFKQGRNLNDLRMSFIRKDGSIMPTLLNAVPILDGNGNYLMSRSTIYDITDLVHAEERVRRLNLLYLTLSETGKAIARLPDRDKLFAEVCRIAVEQGEFLLAWIGLIDEASHEVRGAAASGATAYLEDLRISAAEEPDGEGPTGIAVRRGTYYICNDFQHDPCTRPWHERGKKHGIQASASIALMCEGSVVGALTLYAGQTDVFDREHVELLVQIGADVSFALDNLERESRRQQAEQALREETLQRLGAMEALRRQEHLLIQQNRQAAMGEMIGNIAHQWRQPLNTLGLFTQRLGLFYGTDSFNKEFLDSSVAKSMEIILHMSRTIDDFRNFFSTEREKVDFRADGAIVKALSLVEASFKERKIRLERDDKEQVVIHGFPNEYAQVLLNILLNAKDAFNERNVAAPLIRIGIGTENGVSVVTIADNAGGIPEEIMDKIFDPYFTTKGPQQGTGIGLFMSKSIIENNMGGKLSVQNIRNGAEFRIEV